MEPIYICSICKENITNQIEFSCKHSFCFTCFPYLMYNIVSNGIQKDFFLNDKAEFFCLICKRGKAMFPFLKLYEFFEKISQNATKPKTQPLCEACEKQTSILYCLECNQNFCQNCLELFHKGNKKFEKHQITSLDEKQQIIATNLQRQCKCPAKHLIEVFCKECHSTICKFCSKVFHEDHPQILVSEIMGQLDKIQYQKLQEYIKKLMDDFCKFKNDFLLNIEKKIKNHNKEFNELLEQIINVMYQLKAKNIEKSATESQNFQMKLSLIQSSLAFLKEEIDKNSTSTLHPNKLFQISRLLTEVKKERKLTISDFQMKTDENRYLKDIKEKISQIQKNNEKFLDIFGEKNLFFINKPEPFNDNFFSDPIALLHKKAILLKSLYKPEVKPEFKKLTLEKKRGCKAERTSKYRKSNDFDKQNPHSTSFILNDKTFLVYLSSSNDLCIYDLTLMKQEETILKMGSEIILVSIFPNDSYPTKWLYSANKSGVIRIFDLDEQQKFEKIYSLHTEMEILSAVVFEDKFKELTDNKDYSIYIIISFKYHGNLIPIRIYSLQGQIIREIQNNYSYQFCSAINFFYDENNSKCCFFFGFSNGSVFIYNLKLNQLMKLYDFNYSVISIKFFFKTTQPKKECFLICLHQNNFIKITDIYASDKKKQISIPNSRYINDLCVWGAKDNYLIVAADDENSLTVINLDNLEILFNEELDDFRFENILKVKRIDQNSGEMKESLIVFKYYDQILENDLEGEIILFEN